MPTTALTRLQYVSIGVDGTFYSPGAYRTSPEDVEALLQHVLKTGVKRLSLYFHGGLVGETAAMASAAVIAPAYATAGVHPLMIIWQTGLGETIQRNLTDLATTELFVKLLKVGLKRAAKLLGIDVDSKGAATEMDDATIDAELAKDEPFADFGTTQPDRTARGGLSNDLPEDIQLEQIQAEVEEDLAVDPDLERLLGDPQQTTCLDPDIRAAVSAGASAKGGFLLALAPYLAKAVFNVGRRYWKKRHHDFEPTVIEEILRVAFLANLGTTIWNDMKHSAGDMWKSNDGLFGERQHAGRYLLDRLPALAQNGVEFDLIGHSAGSIAICKLLEAAASGGIALPVRNIVFLAPACTGDLFWNEIASRPERFQRFRMFTMQDRYEKQDRLLSRFYPRSLLFLVSGILESEPDCPLAGLERHLSGNEPYSSNVLQGVHRFLYAPGADRLILSVTSGAPEGLRCSAIHHGGFGEDARVLESIQYLLRF
jgi:hypothetical protein